MASNILHGWAIIVIYKDRRLKKPGGLTYGPCTVNASGPVDLRNPHATSSPRLLPILLVHMRCVCVVVVIRRQRSNKVKENDYLARRMSKCIACTSVFKRRRP
jgi:hypothetical protein